MAPMELHNIDLKIHPQELLESETNSWREMTCDCDTPDCSKCLRISLCSASSQPSLITFFDGSRVNPIKEASLFLDQIRYVDENGAILEENVKEDQEVVSWLVPSTKNESCGKHSRKFSLFDTDLGSPIKWNKDYKWVLDKMFDLASSVSSITDSSDWHSSSFSSFSSFGSDNSSEILDLEECSIDKPLFWPSDLTPEWGLNTEWDLFIMSPRKHVCIVSNSPNTPPDTPRLRLWNAKMDSEKSTKRRFVFHSRSNSSASVDLKTTNGTKSVRRMKSMPTSRFKKGTKTNIDDACTKEASEAKELAKKTMVKPKVFLEDLLLTEKLNAEPNIESILGLDEFDGHEGIEFEFNKDDFFLDVIM